MITYFPENLGERIKMIRIQLGCNMEEFGKKLNPPVAKGTISKWESGKYMPNTDRLHQIAKLVNIRPAYLMSGNPFDNLSPQEQEEWQEAHYAQQRKNECIRQFKEEKYVRLEDFINPVFPRFIYINGHKLEKDEIEMLLKLYEGKEKNYPSDEEIENEYNALRDDYMNYSAKKKKNQYMIYYGESTHYKYHK